ncbi:MAG: hypothetical protein U0736_25650 [Gemmataceae bacterium]
MGNHVKGCSCRSCKFGMHTKTGSRVVQKVIRRARRLAKEALRRGEEPVPCVSRGFTD